MDRQQTRANVIQCRQPAPGNGRLTDNHEKLEKAIARARPLTGTRERGHPARSVSGIAANGGQDARAPEYFKAGKYTTEANMLLKTKEVKFHKLRKRTQNELNLARQVSALGDKSTYFEPIVTRDGLSSHTYGLGTLRTWKGIVFRGNELSHLLQTNELTHLECAKRTGFCV